MDRNAGVERFLRDVVHLLDGDLIDFVVDIETLDVLPIAFDHVDELINIVVSSEGNVGIMNFILVHDVGYHLLVDFSELDNRIELDSSCLLGMDHDVGLLLVQPDSNCFKLAGQLLPLDFSFLAVEHH